MVNLLVKIAIFFGSIFLLVYSISTFDNNKKINDSNVLKLKVASENFKNLDYLFVGSSYVYCAIQPSYFDSLGLRSFNMGVASAGPYFYELVVDDYIKKTGKIPKNIIFNIAYTTFSDIASDGWIGYPIHRYLNYPKSNEYVFYNYCDAATYLKILRKSFKKAFTNLFSEEAQTDGMYKILLSTKGFSGGDDLFTDSIYALNKYHYIPYLKSSFSYKKLDHLLKMTKKYSNMGIKVHLIEIPTFRLHDFFNDDYKTEYNKVFNKFEDNPILRYHEVISNDCFSNIDHMNNNGADVYTRYLINSLHIK